MTIAMIDTVRRLTAAIAIRHSPYLCYQVLIDLALADLGIAPDRLDRRFYKAQILHGVHESFSPREVATLISFFLPVASRTSFAEGRIGRWEQSGQIRPGFAVMARDLASYMRLRRLSNNLDDPLVASTRRALANEVTKIG